ncbi:phage tail protein [Parvibium lacunae]|uniref:DUF1983 domain-containing protein n=1 Tax=Parvibium lacunae TaxID=1888893 RepID=A0A368L833_9BURK|nr:phage tail protein [Parvibium lacunae]RCS59712.1 DUF1983 domain-containing protein [Parvibium lacunae]
MGFASTPTINTEDQRIDRLRIQQSAAGQAVPVLFGRNRIAASLLYYNDFVATPHVESQSGGGGGGKGAGGGAQPTRTSYTYSAAIMLAIAEGTIESIERVWADKSNSSLADAGLSLFNGQTSQAVWGYLTAKHPDQAVPYSGLAYAAAGGLSLGSDANLPNYSFEAQSAVKRAAERASGDAHPADCINQLLTNPRYGAGFPAAMLASDATYRAYCTANGFFISPVLSEARPAADWLREWLDITNSAAVWSEGKLKLVPYGDEAATANGASYVPNNAAVYDLNADHFLNKDAPIQVKRKRNADAYNSVKLEYVNRADQYNVATVEAQDQAAIDLYGKRPASGLTYKAITTTDLATKVAQHRLIRFQQVRNEYEFRVGEQFALLEPMDIVTLTDVGLGLDKLPVRIIAIDEDDDGYQITAEDFPRGASGASYTTQVPTSFALNSDIAPGPSNTPVLFEPPNVMVAPNTELWIGTSGGAYWGGCEVWVSRDNASYRRIGTITSPARHGVLSAALPAGADPDTSNQLSVNLTVSGGVLAGTTQAGADAGDTLCYVDGEIVSFQTAQLVAPNRYTLGYLRRGQRGSNIAAHPQGSAFMRLDAGVFQFPIPREEIGQPLWLKFPAYNTFGRSLQSLAECTAYQYTPTGNRPAAPSSLTTTAGLFEVALSAAYAPKSDLQFIEFWVSGTNDRSTASPFASIRTPGNTARHTGRQPGSVAYYWCRLIDSGGNASEFFPASPLAGVAGSPSADPSALLNQLNNSITEAQLTAPLRSSFQAIAPLTEQGSDTRNQLNSAADALFQAILQLDRQADQLRAERRVSTATVDVNEATGQIVLKATAQITTDVEARLTSVQTQINGVNATQSTQASQIVVQDGRLTAAETTLQQQANSIALRATQAYVDTQLAILSGALDPQLVKNELGLLAQALQRLALLNDDARSLTREHNLRLATAEFNITANTTELQAQATARLALAALVADQAAALLVEQTARATADNALSSQLTALQAQSNSNASAISTEVLARANADNALSSLITTLQAQANGLQAAINQEASVRASADGQLQAQWVLTLNANGHISGIQLANNTQTGSSMLVTVDKFAVVLPSGNGGTPQYPFVIGLVNGQSTVGINGALVVDGSIVTRSLAANSVTAEKIVAQAITADKMNVNSLSSITANIGKVTAGRMQNTGNTNFINLGATGGQNFLRVGNNIILNADGSGYFARTLVSAPNVKASGSYAVISDVLGMNSTWSTIIDTGINSTGDWATASTEKYLASCNISDQISWGGGLTGIASATVFVGDGAGTSPNGYTEGRFYIKFDWIGPGNLSDPTRAIQIRGIAWTLDQV